MPANQTNTAAVDTLSFEAALSELEHIVREMETGKTGLENSINAYERGILLRNHCQKRLADAQLRIQQITGNADGTFSLSAAQTETN